METTVSDQVGIVRRLARYYRTALESCLDGKQEIGMTVHSLGLFSHSRELYACNSPAVQPLKNFFRSFDKQHRLLNHVLSPAAFLLALRQELEIAEAETIELSQTETGSTFKVEPA